MDVYKLKESKEEITVLVGVGSPEEAGTQQGVPPGVRAAQSFESRERE